MKTKLLVFLLGATLLGSSTAALAERGHRGGHDGPRVEQQADNRHGAHSRHHTRRDNHERGHRWSRGHRYGHSGSQGRHYGHHARREVPRVYYHEHVGLLPPPPPLNRLSIILRGHF